MMPPAVQDGRQLGLRPAVVVGKPCGWARVAQAVRELRTHVERPPPVRPQGNCQAERAGEGELVRRESSDRLQGSAPEDVVAPDARRIAEGVATSEDGVADA